MLMTETPRVYVACLGCYNAGKLNGHWLDVDEYTTHEAIAEAFDADEETGYFPCGDLSPHEEYAFHDFENWGEYSPDEYDDLEFLRALAELMGEHGEAVSALASYCSSYQDADTLRTAFEDHYEGEFKNAKDFAQEYHERLGTEIPQWVEYYIDWERMGKDMLREDWFSVDGGAGIYVFRRH